MRLLGLLALAVVSASCANEESVDISESCAAFVACTAARDEVRGVSTNLDRYVEGGDCWDNPEIAALCTTSCTRGMDYLNSRFADLPEVCAQ